MQSSPESVELESLSDARCWELLNSQDVGRLAVTIKGEPDLFPVNYALDGKRIVIRTAPGTKLAAAIDHAVAFEVDALTTTRRTGWSVVVRGRATEPKHIEDYLGSLDLGIEPWAAGTKDRFICIEPTSVVGRVLPPAATTGWRCHGVG